VTSIQKGPKGQDQELLDKSCIFPFDCQCVVPDVEVPQISIGLQCLRDVDSVVISELVPFQIKHFQWWICRQEIRNTSVVIRSDSVATEIDVIVAPPNRRCTGLMLPFNESVSSSSLIVGCSKMASMRSQACSVLWNALPSPSKISLLICYFSAHRRQI